MIQSGESGPWAARLAGLRSEETATRAESFIEIRRFVVRQLGARPATALAGDLDGSVQRYVAALEARREAFGQAADGAAADSIARDVLGTIVGETGGIPGSRARAAREREVPDVARLRAALGRLDAQTAAVIELRRSPGWPVRRVAAQLGIPADTARTAELAGLVAIAAETGVAGAAESSNEIAAVVLQGDEHERLALLSNARGRQGVAGCTRDVLELDLGLRALFTIEGDASPAAAFVAGTAFGASDARADRALLLLQIALLPSVRAEVEATSRFLGVDADVLEGAPIIALPTRRQVATADQAPRASRLRLPLAAAVALLCVGLALWLWPGGESEPVAVERPLAAETEHAAVERNEASPTAPGVSAPAPPQRRPSTRETTAPVRAAGRTPNPAAPRRGDFSPSTIQANVGFSLRGVTNPDTICESLRDADWGEEGCGQETLGQLLRDELTAQLRRRGDPNLFPPHPELDIDIMHLRETKDGLLRMRGKVTFPSSDEPPWTIHAAFDYGSADDQVRRGDLVELATATVVPERLCQWGMQEGLWLCELPSRYLPELIKHVPDDEVWVLDDLRWESPEALRTYTLALSRGARRERLEVMTREGGTLPHWQHVSGDDR